MNYYTSNIPLPLAEKLKEKGMPMKDAYTPILYDKPESVMSGCIIPTYAEVFDWFLEKEIYVNAYPERIMAIYGEYVYMYRPYVNGMIGKGNERKVFWHEAANAAIEKALTLI